ncbi:hypothetical protein BDR22DRAFT_958534 [Usnea florida]
MSDVDLLVGVVVGLVITPIVFGFNHKATQSKSLDLTHTFRPCYHLRRPPIGTAPLSRTPWRWIRRAGGRYQVGTSLIAPGRWLSPLSSTLLRDTREAWPSDLVRPTTGVTQGQKKRSSLDIRRAMQPMRDTDPCSDNTWLKRISYEESVGAYWYRETLRGTVRTLISKDAFYRQSHPTESYKAGQ